jgi:hypothetical protein
MEDRLLNIDDAAIDRILASIAWARDHIYDYDRDRRQISDRNRVEIEDGYTCQFTLTRKNGILYRHLGVAVDDPPHLPHEDAVCALAHAFGFETPDSDSLDLIAAAAAGGWWILPVASPPCVMVLQEIERIDN